MNSGSGSSLFRRIGRLVVRRRSYIIVAWILALIIVVPLLGGLGKVTSLMQGSASGSQLESVLADNIITAQFQKTVPNSTLLIVVSTKNASSVSTQQTVAQITSKLKSNTTIAGLQSSVDVYSTFYSILRGINGGVYTTFDLANATVELLLGVPAIYYNAWVYANRTLHQDAMSSNRFAYTQTNATLFKIDAAAYAYALPVLISFNYTWVMSWQSQPSLIPFQRASYAASITDQAFLSFNPSQKAFGEALLSAISFQDFVNASSTVPQRLSAFAVYIVATTGLLSPVLVSAAYSLGRTYSNSSLYALTGKIIWSPHSFGVNGEFASLIGSFVSPSRDTTLISLGFDKSSNSNLLAVRSIVRSSLASQGAGSDVQAALVTGSDALNYDIGNSTQSDIGIILPVTIVLLILATGLFFRSALTPFITLGTIGVALGISQIFILIVGTYIAKVDFTIPTILLTVLIGVGTDYSVFVIARYREERVRGLSVQDAVQTSVTWAGESIATSGATVIISFLALGFTSISFLQTMGFVVGLGVLVALLVALTLVPAVVTIVGGRTFWPNSGDRFARYASSVKSKLQAKRGYFSRSGGFAVKHAKVLILLAVIASIPALYVYATATPTYDFLAGSPKNVESIQASTQLTNSFGGGRLFPTYVVVRFNNALVNSYTFNTQEMSVLSQISTYILSNPDIQNVTGPTRPFGSPVSYSSLNPTNSSDLAIFTAIMQTIGKNNATALITANFRIDPYSTQAINDASTIRTYLHQKFDQAPFVSELLVGGASGSILDTKNVFTSQFGSVLPIVAIGVAIVLLLVLGSVFLPVFAVISILMSIIWTLAATQLVFQSLFNYQILFLIPLFLFVTLLGLGMDYNVFILTRIREEATKGENLNDAIIHAIEQTGGIITAAAIILAGSLGALMLSGNLLLKEIGFAFSYSILIDALVVRTYLVPAVMSLAKKWNWYNPIGFLHRSRALYESRNQTPKDAGD